MVGFVVGVGLGFVVKLAYGDHLGPAAWLIPVGAGIVLGLAGRFLALRSSGSPDGLN
ncbi:MAG TPA: hypothetical protein VGB74_04340 [Actinoplanes sp.]